MEGQIKMAPTRNIHTHTHTHTHTVRANNSIKYYIGAMEGTFKQRTYAHKFSFSNRKYSNTTLSACIWKLKDRNITPSITWKVIKSAPANNEISWRCLLYFQEKVAITHPSQNTIKP